jgi:hypothetical protein
MPRLPSRGKYHTCRGSRGVPAGLPAVAHEVPMAPLPKIAFADAALPETGTLVLLASEGVSLGPLGTALEAATDDLVAACARFQKFKGKRFKTMTVLSPRATKLDRLIVVGLG